MEEVVDEMWALSLKGFGEHGEIQRLERCVKRSIVLLLFILVFSALEKGVKLVNRKPAARKKSLISIILRFRIFLLDG